jgi:hypothetical protein
MITKLAPHILDVRQIYNSGLQVTIIYIIKKQCSKSKNKNRQSGTRQSGEKMI